MVNVVHDAVNNSGFYTGIENTISVVNKKMYEWGRIEVLYA